MMGQRHWKALSALVVQNAQAFAHNFVEIET